ncbi:hypothetical protein GE061_018729 [Apolygus lucorum]|uniref:NB-ARC domain-containing protein n=1 Tax=Apolygus lucorum TaxID=248454 RepID=A0A8S9X7S6_APOLU|nr:hypothetical protein GE061_018729 [Apolygus lucorum]
MLHAGDASKSVAIAGLGGVGKSELARKYAKTYSSLYDDKVVWVHAESYQSLVESFHRLASDVLKITTKNANDEEKEIRSIVEDVYKFFSKGKSLFIFDNAERFKTLEEYDQGLDKFLPALPTGCKKPHFLITTRNLKWPKSVIVLPLDTFCPDEAEEFIIKSLNLEGINKKHVTELANELQYFPLALQQAVAYIKVQNEKLSNVGSNFNIKDYLNRNKTRAKELLDFEFPEDSDNDYTKTIMRTWVVTFDEIARKDCGQHALDIVNIVAYVSADDIPTEMFSGLVDDAEALGSAIELLKQYSIVTNLKNRKFDVHRLLQKIVRLQLRDKKEEKNVLTSALQLFSNEAVNLTNVEHAIMVWQHSSAYSDVISEFCHVALSISRVLLKACRWEEAHSFSLKVTKLFSKMVNILPDRKNAVGNDEQIKHKLLIFLIVMKKLTGRALMEMGKCRMALEHYRTSLDLVHQTFDAEHVAALSIKYSIGHALRFLGEYDDALRHFEEAYSGLTLKLGDEDEKTLQAKSGICLIFFKRGMLTESLKMCKEIHRIQESKFGKYGNPTLFSKIQMAKALDEMEKYEEALEIFEDVKNYQGKTLGENHPDTLRTKFSIAGVLSKWGRGDPMSMYKEILAAHRQIYGEEHLAFLDTLSNIGLEMYKKGEYNEAIKILQKVLDKKANILGPNHEDLLITRYNVAIALNELGKHEEALSKLQDLLPMQCKLLGSTHPQTNRTKLIIADQLASHGKFDKAIKQFRDVKVNSPTDIPASNLDFQFNVGVQFLNQGQYDGALEIYQNLLEKQLKCLKSDDPELLITKYHIGETLERKGQYSEASAVFEDELRSAKVTLGEDHDDTLIASLHLAHCKAMLGQFGEAQTLCQAAMKTITKIPGKCCTPKIIYALHSVSAVFHDNDKHNEALEIDRFLVYHQTRTQNDNSDFNNHKENTSLLAEVRDGNCEKLEKVLKRGEDVNSSDKDNRTLLHHAVDMGNEDIVNLLLKYGADVTKVTNKGNTPLHIATARGHKIIVETLLQYKKDDFINAKTTIGGTTSLHVAAERGLFDIVVSLLKHGGAYDIKNKKGKTAFDLAEDSCVVGFLKSIAIMFERAAKGDTNLISMIEKQELRLKKAIMNATDSKRMSLIEVARTKNKKLATQLSKLKETCKGDAECSSQHGNQASHPKFEDLMAAVKDGKVDELEEFLKKGGEVNLVDQRSGTLLHRAVDMGNVDVVNLLLKYGADVTKVTDKGNTPLHIATARGHKIIVETLLQYKKDDFINAKTTIGGTTSLHVAAERGLFDIVVSLLKHGGAYDIKNKKGKTALDLAEDSCVVGFLKSIANMFERAAKGDTNLISMIEKQELRLKKAIMNATDSKRMSLIEVARTKNKKLATQLSKLKETCKGDAECSSQHGNQASHPKFEDLMAAVKDGKVDELEEFLKKGGEVNLVDQKSGTLLHRAVDMGNVDVVNLLLKHGADVTKVTDKGNTPLHIATARGHKIIVETLLQYKKDDFINAKTTIGGTTSLHVAAERGLFDIVVSLLKHGGAYDIKNKKGKTAFDLAEDSCVVGFLKSIANMFERAAKGDTNLISMIEKQELRLKKAIMNATDSKRMSLIEVARTKNKKLATQLSKLKETCKGDAECSSQHGNQASHPKFEDLMAAVKDGKVDELEEFLKKGGEVNLVDQRSGTLLHRAVDMGNVDVVNLLLKYGADVTKVTDKGNTPLHIATARGHKIIVETLLQYKKDDFINAKTTIGGTTSLHVAAERGLFDIVVSLLKHGGAYDIKNKKGKTALDLAEDSCVVGFLKSIANMFERAAKGDTNLISMIEKQELRLKKAIMNATDSKRMSLIEVARTKNKKLATQLSKLKETCKGDAECSSQHGNQASHPKFEDLMAAVKDGKVDELEEFLKKGGEVNLVDQKSGTLLHRAVDMGNVDVVNLLLKHGADVTKVTDKGNTPLHIATARGHKIIVETLLQYKKDDFINAKTTIGGTTSLHVAAERGLFDIVVSLLKHGGAYDIKNKKGKTAFDLAEDSCVVGFLKSIANMFERAAKGDTNLISMIEKQELRLKKAIMNATDSNRMSLIEVARTKNKKLATQLSKLKEIYKGEASHPKFEDLMTAEKDDVEKIVELFETVGNQHIRTMITNQETVNSDKTNEETNEKEKEQEVDEMKCINAKHITSMIL